MSKKKPVVLILEDNALLRSRTKEYLEEEGFKVLDCQNIYEAKAEWKEHKFSIDAISLDTNMPSTGLTEEEQALTNDGIFSGWIWLIKYVLVDQELPFPIRKVFVVSEYIPNLEEHITGRTEFKCEEFDALKKMKHLIKKGGKRMAIDILVEALKKELDL